MANVGAGSYEVDPISRIEGHLGVKVTTDINGKVTSANVHGNLWRGFENFLIGRNPNDAITFTQRICGVCPLPHATASMFGVESVYGYNQNGVTFSDKDNDGLGVPAKAVHIRNLVYASEFLMSHITHFYHLVAPSYIQGPNIAPWTPYFDDSYYHPLMRNTGAWGVNAVPSGQVVGGAPDAASRATLPVNSGGFSDRLWSAVIKQYVKALRIRRLTFEAGALFAGRMPMVSAFIAGGTTNDTADGTFATRCDKFAALTTEVADFILKEYVPVTLALGALYPNYDNLGNATTLQSHFPELWGLAGNVSGTAPTTDDTGYGAGCKNFLAWGAFPNPADNVLTIAGGTKIGSDPTQMLLQGKSAVTFPNTCPSAMSVTVKAALKEHIKHSNYGDLTPAEYTGSAAYPGSVSRTVPDRSGGTSGEKYSWLKAPRWNGNPMEVGPYARMVVNGWYPVSGDALLTNTIGGLYPLYVKTAGGHTGLNPRCVEPDLAVALVREGLAGVTTATGAPSTEAAIVDAYVNDPTAVIDGTIFTWIANLAGGYSTMDRIRARALEALFLVTKMIGAPTVPSGTTAVSWPTMDGWIGALKNHVATGSASNGTYIVKATPTTAASGFGFSEAPRGALAHFVSIDGGKIAKYQCVVPTTWNASPKDASDVAGPIEQAMIGIPFSAEGGEFVGQNGNVKTTGGGVEALRVAQSFDPCIACAIH